jgi:BirA family biotin operon repressor/biotin-[acetyl-CoA-carboxylase] ligase
LAKLYICGKVNILYHNSELSFGHHQLELSEVTSTNDFAKQLAEENLAGHGSFIRADFQTKGRGQELNVWEAEKGKNLLCSLIMLPQQLQADEQVYLNITVCLGVYDMVKHYLPEAAVSIKWPNDIYVGDKKAAGILIENSLQGMQIKQCVAGMGININQISFRHTRAVSLGQVSGMEYDVKECAEVLLDRLDQRYHMLMSGHRDKLWHDYHEVLYRKGVPSFFETEEEQLHGTVKGIDTAGRLLLETGTETRAFHVKQIRWL